MDESVNQLGTLKSDLERQVTSAVPAGITGHLRMGSTAGFTFFEEGDVPGTTTFTPGAAGTGITITASPITLTQVAGQDLGALQAYTAIANGQSVTDVAGIATLRLRLDNPMSAGNQAALRVDLTDSVGACAGQLILTVGAGLTPPRNIQVDTYDAYGGACVAAPTGSAHRSDTLIGCTAPCVSPTQFFLDALDPELGFAAVLAKTAPDYTVSFTLSGSPAATASMVFAFDQIATGGVVRVGGGGFTTPTYSTTLSDGTLTYHKPNLRFASQTYVLEYGALMLEQGFATVMVSTPAFQVSATASQVHVQWVLPALTGVPNQVGGTTSATITSAPAGSSASLAGLAPSVTFSLTTDHGAVWQQYWRETMAQAGLSEPSHFTTSTTTTSATLTVLGSGTGNDVVVDFQSIPLTIQIQPGS